MKLFVFDFETTSRMFCTDFKYCEQKIFRFSLIHLLKCIVKLIELFARLIYASPQ